MSKETKAILHRVKCYAGKTLVSVVPDLLEDAAKAMMEEWLDVDLDRHCECDTLKCNDSDETIIDDEELALATAMRVYMFATQAGIINVVAKSQEIAQTQLTRLLEQVETEHDIKINIEAVNDGERVHIIADEMGLLWMSVNAKDIYEASITPFEE